MLQMLNYYYVDTIDMSNIVEKGIIEMLKELDPHSVYIAKKDLQKTTEPLQGNFEGVGVQFQIMNVVVAVLVHLLDMQEVAAGFTLGPEACPCAGPESDHTLRTGLVEGLAVHIAQHQHLAGAGYKTKCLEIGVLLQMDKTSNRSRYRTCPYEDKQAPPPITLTAKCYECQR